MLLACRGSETCVVTWVWGVGRSEASVVATVHWPLQARRSQPVRQAQGRGLVGGGWPGLSRAEEGVKIDCRLALTKTSLAKTPPPVHLHSYTHFFPTHRVEASASQANGGRRSAHKPNVGGLCPVSCHPLSVATPSCPPPPTARAKWPAANPHHALHSPLHSRLHSF